MPTGIYTRTKEQKQRISAGLKRCTTHRVHREGHTEESRLKISRVRIEKGVAKGRKNPMYGVHLTGEKNGMYGVSLIGEKNPNWNGGRQITTTGYVKILVGPRTYKFEHSIFAEKALGREIKANEVVHHINGNKLDNRNSNLLICSKSYHHCLHNKMARLYAMEHFN